MRLSTRGRYGVHAMYYLAIKYGGDPVALSEIAKETGLSENYLEQLIRSLKKADLVRSIRGSQGGYLLSKKPCDISIGEILRNLEVFFGPTECSILDHVCSREESCAPRSVWRKIQESIDNTVNAMSLQDMINGTIK